MIVPPVTTGSTGSAMRTVPNARVSSNRPIASAMATTPMNASLTTNSDAMTIATRPTPTAIDAGRLRPARLVLSATAGMISPSGVSSSGETGGVSSWGDSDLKELCLFVLEHLVDDLDVLLGQ